MTKKNQIINAALKISGDRTLDSIKTLLAENGFVDSRDYTSEVMRNSDMFDIIKTGKQISYRLKKSHVANDNKMYVLLFDSGVMCAEKKAIEDFIIDNDLPIRYSESKDDFIRIEDMNFVHIKNALIKDLKSCKTREELEFNITNNILVKELFQV